MNAITQMPLTEAEYGRKMLALCRSEGHWPNWHRWPTPARRREHPLDPWMVEVLRRSADPDGFRVTTHNCRALGAPKCHLKQVMSPLVTRKLVKVDSRPSSPRVFHLADAGRKYLADLEVSQ